MPFGSASDYTATIAWGDGTVDTVNSAGGGITQSGSTFTVHGSHTYSAAGAQTPFTVTITDNGAATATQAAGVVPVAPAPLTITGLTPPREQHYLVVLTRCISSARARAAHAESRFWH